MATRYLIVIYEVEFPDSDMKEYANNAFAQNFMLQVYFNDHYTQMLDCIADVRCDDRAVTKADDYIMTKRGQA